MDVKEIIQPPPDYEEVFHDPLYGASKSQIEMTNYNQNNHSSTSSSSAHSSTSQSSVNVNQRFSNANSSPSSSSNPNSNAKSNSNSHLKPNPHPNSYLNPNSNSNSNPNSNPNPHVQHNLNPTSLANHTQSQANYLSSSLVPPPNGVPYMPVHTGPNPQGPMYYADQGLKGHRKKFFERYKNRKKIWLIVCCFVFFLLILIATVSAIVVLINNCENQDYKIDVSEHPITQPENLYFQVEKGNTSIAVNSLLYSKVKLERRYKRDWKYFSVNTSNNTYNFPNSLALCGKNQVYVTLPPQVSTYQVDVNDGAVDIENTTSRDITVSGNLVNLNIKDATARNMYFNFTESIPPSTIEATDLRICLLYIKNAIFVANKLTTLPSSVSNGGTCVTTIIWKDDYIIAEVKRQVVFVYDVILSDTNNYNELNTRILISLSGFRGRYNVQASNIRVISDIGEIQRTGSFTGEYRQSMNLTTNDSLDVKVAGKTVVIEFLG